MGNKVVANSKFRCLLLSFTLIFLVVTIALLAAWDDFDTSFLDGKLDK